MTTPLDHIRPWQDELTAIRRDIHAHPELGFEETAPRRSSRRSSRRWGIEVHRGIGRTGVVGVHPRRAHGDTGRAIGLRADMDALPMQEANGFAHALAPRRQDARLRP